MQNLNVPPQEIVSGIDELLTKHQPGELSGALTAMFISYCRSERSVVYHETEKQAAIDLYEFLLYEIKQYPVNS